MKKIKIVRKSLAELRGEMEILSKADQEGMIGCYKDDCFWRCIAYHKTGGQDYSEEKAEEYANSYFATTPLAGYGDEGSVEAYLEEHGSGMTISDISAYRSQEVQAGNYHINIGGEYIGMFKTDNVSTYDNTGTYHAVIVKEVREDGSMVIFDPQQANNSNGGIQTLSPEDAKHVYRAFY